MTKKGQIQSDVLDAREASGFLNVHVETIRRLARKDEIPSFKVGKDWRFLREDLIKWLQTHHLRNQLPAILVVDDESQVRSFFRKLFQKRGFQVFEAADGESGLACLKRETVDLILLDLKMPVMNGAEFLAVLREDKIKIPVILITGHPDSHLIQDAMQYSPLMLMPKPVVKDQVMDTVRALIKFQD